MHAIGSIPCRPCTGASCDGLVVTEASGWGRGGGKIAAETKGEVIAVTLRGGACVEAAEDDIGYSLRLGK